MEESTGGTKFFLRQHEEQVLQALEKLLTLGFLAYNFNKLTWPVYSHDVRLRWYKKVMTEEAVLKEEYFYNGRFRDRHYLSMTRKEFDKRLS